MSLYDRMYNNQQEQGMQRGNRLYEYLTNPTPQPITPTNKVDYKGYNPSVSTPMANPQANIQLPSLSTLSGLFKDKIQENEDDLNAKTEKGAGDKIDDFVNVGTDVATAFNGGGGYGSMATGAMNSLNTLGKGGSLGDAGQSFFGIDAENDSDVMQGIKGAGRGAMMGSTFGPVGTAVGALLGLGSSFLDDI